MVVHIALHKKFELTAEVQEGGVVGVECIAQLDDLRDGCRLADWTLLLRKLVESCILVDPGTHLPLLADEAALRRHKQRPQSHQYRLVSIQKALHDVETFLKRKAFLKGIERGNKGFECHDLLFLSQLGLLVEFGDGADINVVVGLQLVLQKMLQLRAMQERSFGFELDSGDVCVVGGIGPPAVDLYLSLKVLRVGVLNLFSINLSHSKYYTTTRVFFVTDDQTHQ